MLTMMKGELKEMEHNNKYGSAEWTRTPECFEIKVEHSDTEAEVPAEGAIEKIVRIKKDEGGAIFEQEFVDSDVDQKMEKSDYDVFEETENDMKLEEKKFKDMGMPDSIDIGDEFIVREIKQEELIIKSENENSCKDNTNQEERSLDIKQSLGITSKSWDDSTIVTNSSCREYDSETKYENHKKQHKDGEFSCGDPTNSKDNFKIHNGSTEIKKFCCTDCDYQTKRKFDLKIHILRHKSATEIEMFCCGDCDFQTKYKRNLKTHMLRHKSATDIDMFSCGKSDYQTKYKNYLKAHKLQHRNSVEIEIFSCGE